MKNKLTAIVAASLIGGSVLLSIKNYIDNNHLKPENFEKAEWIKVYNPDERIWNAYMKENIPHNQVNWQAYCYEVQKRNLLSTKPYISLPDLDGNGIVNQ